MNAAANKSIPLHLYIYVCKYKYTHVNTYPWSGFIVEWTGNVNRTSCILHAKGIAYVTACDLVSNIRG